MAGATASAQAHDVAATLSVLAGAAVPAASVGSPIWDALHPSLRAERKDHADAVIARASTPGHAHPPAGAAWPIARLVLAALAVLLACRPRPTWAFVGASPPCSQCSS